MKVRSWQDIISDVVESNADPEGWRAVAGDRRGGIGEDLYIGHPAAGLFFLKTYAKNPFDVKGVGTEVARSVDEELESLLPTGDDGRFAVQQAPADESEAEAKASELETVLKTHAEAPTSPQAVFDDVMETLDSPAYGPMEYDPLDRPETLDEFSTTFEDAEDVLETEFEDLLDADEVGRGFQ